MKEIKILSAYTGSDLGDSINKRLSEGWSLKGELIVSILRDKVHHNDYIYDTRYTQMLIKDLSEELK